MQRTGRKRERERERVAENDGVSVSESEDECSAPEEEESEGGNAFTPKELSVILNAPVGSIALKMRMVSERGKCSNGRSSLPLWLLISASVEVPVAEVSSQPASAALAGGSGRCEKRHRLAQLW